jgi:hypothetical protein
MDCAPGGETHQLVNSQPLVGDNETLPVSCHGELPDGS